jgi:hypothetical protein
VTRGDNHYTFQAANGQIVTVPGFPAQRGYDLSTGWGTVDADHFCRELAGMAGEDESAEARDAARNP